MILRNVKNILSGILMLVYYFVICFFRRSGEIQRSRSQSGKRPVLLKNRTLLLEGDEAYLDTRTREQPRSAASLSIGGRPLLLRFSCVGVGVGNGGDVACLGTNVSVLRLLEMFIHRVRGKIAFIYLFNASC